MIYKCQLKRKVHLERYKTKGIKVTRPLPFTWVTGDEKDASLANLRDNFCVKEVKEIGDVA